MSIWHAASRITNRVTRDTFSGDSVLYIPTGGNAFSIRAPYWREHYSADPDTQAPVRSTDPKVSVLYADLKGHTLSNRDNFEVDGETWGVDRIEDDKAQGSAMVFLTKTVMII